LFFDSHLKQVTYGWRGKHLSFFNRHFCGCLVYSNKANAELVGEFWFYQLVTGNSRGNEILI